MKPTVRKTKRDLVVDFFTSNIGKTFGTAELHAMFGTAFRSRVSEINRSVQYNISIRNRTVSVDCGERSEYWAENRRLESFATPGG